MAINYKQIGKDTNLGKAEFNQWAPEIQEIYRQNERMIKDARLTSDKYYKLAKQAALKGQLLTQQIIDGWVADKAAKGNPLANWRAQQEVARATLQAQADASLREVARLTPDANAYRAAHGSLTNPASWLGILRDRNTSVGAGLAGLSALAGYGLAKLQNNLSYQPPEYDEVNMDYADEYLGERGD